MIYRALENIHCMLELSITPAARILEPWGPARNQPVPAMRKSGKSTTSTPYRVTMKEELYWCAEGKVPVHIACWAGEKFELLGEMLCWPWGLLGTVLLQLLLTILEILLTIQPVMLISSVNTYHTYLLASRIREKKHKGKYHSFCSSVGGFRAIWEPKVGNYHSWEIGVLKVLSEDFDCHSINLVFMVLMEKFWTEQEINFLTWGYAAVVKWS